MELYISGSGVISGAGNNMAEDFPLLTEQPTDRMLGIEPDYTGEIPPMQLRRMSKSVRMGIAAAKICLRESGIEKPDAISVGTAMGCLYDTDIFLQKMIAQDEQMLTPTSFIQSTHNTVAGQIALLTGCYGHNLTYVQRGHSFEHALINAQLYLDEHPEEKMLAGGIDELTDTSLSVLKRASLYRQHSLVPASILNSTGIGSLSGEGAAFFVVTGQKNESTALHIKDITVFIGDANTAGPLEMVKAFLLRNNIDTKDIDLVMLGINGDERTAAFYNTLRNETFADNSQAAFKHLSGEYGTASAFALGLLAHIVKQNKVPGPALLNHQPEQLKNILLINNYMHYFSCWHISA